MLLLWSTICHAVFQTQQEDWELVLGTAELLHNFMHKVELLGDKSTLHDMDFQETEPLQFCQLGVGVDSVGLLRLFLGVFSNSTFNIFESHAHVSYAEWNTVMGPFVHQIQYYTSLDEYEKVCDVIIWGMDSHLFSIKKIQSLYKREAGSEDGSVLVFYRHGCEEEVDIVNISIQWERQYCRYLMNLWHGMVCNSLPAKFSGCTSFGCICFTPAVSLIDPTYDENINCRDFTGALPEGEFQVTDRNSLEWRGPGEIYLGSGQWNQDWFIYHNFFHHYTEPGYYVDVGAMAPFVLSNTVALEYCGNWSGTCIEPNPHNQVSMHVYRACRLLNICIGNYSSRRFVYETDTSLTRSVDSDFNHSASGFLSQCVSLESTLAYLGKVRVDYLNVDVEGNEIEIFEHFPFATFDIRVVSVEVSHTTSHVIDLIFLTQGYVKVAVLGRDVVYVSERHLSEMPTVWPLIFPPKMRIFPYDEEYKKFQARFKDPAFGS